MEEPKIKGWENNSTIRNILLGLLSKIIECQVNIEAGKANSG